MGDDVSLLEVPASIAVLLEPSKFPSPGCPQQLEETWLLLFPSRNRDFPKNSLKSRAVRRSYLWPDSG